MSIVHGNDLQETCDLFALEFHTCALGLGRGVLARALFLGVSMAALEVRDPVFPATIEDSNPLVRERTDGRVVFLAACKLALVIRPRACGVQNGVKGFDTGDRGI
jgi:hypothetical protein